MASLPLDVKNAFAISPLVESMRWVASCSAASVAKKSEWQYDTPSVNWSINAWVTLGVDQIAVAGRGIEDAVFIPFVATSQACYRRTTSSVEDLLSIAEIEIIPSCCNSMEGFVMERAVQHGGLVQFAIDLRSATDDLIIIDIRFPK